MGRAGGAVAVPVPGVILGRRPTRVTPDRVVDALSQYGGTVLRSSLSKEGEKEIQDALHGGNS